MTRYSITRGNVTNQVIEFLKENIENGTWKPGEKISSENELAEHLGVSRSSVRYAIQHLVAVGALTSYQGKGTFVNALEMGDLVERLDGIYVNSDIAQLLQFRIIIETQAIKLAVKNLDEENFARLHQYLDNMKANRSNNRQFIRNDIAFHNEILRATGNKLIYQSLSCVREELEKQHRRFNTPRGVDLAVKYHTEILERLEKGDAKGASRAMENHLRELVL